MVTKIWSVGLPAGPVFGGEGAVAALVAMAPRAVAVNSAAFHPATKFLDLWVAPKPDAALCVRVGLWALRSWAPLV